MKRYLGLLAGLILAAPAAAADRPDPAALAVVIDRHVGERLVSEQVPPAPRADDAEFFRRANLVLAGRVPVPSEVRLFLADTDPDKRRKAVEKLLASLRDFPLRNRERLTFEYVLLGDVNDSPTHAHELVDLIRGLRAKLNLIALNPGPEIPYATPDASRVAAFQQILISAGIPTFLRRPRGRDIYAACGQLKHTTELVQLS